MTQRAARKKLSRDVRNEDVECIVCHVAMPNLSATSMQPFGGTSFDTTGHYGSAITDHMNGTRYSICVCDPCLDDNLRTGAAQKILPRPN